MADDLDSFFAKKAAKKNKKALCQDTESLARKLEKTVKHQEQIDKIHEEEDRIHKERVEAAQNNNVEVKKLIKKFLKLFRKQHLFLGRFRMD